MKFILESKTATTEIYRADIGQGLSAVVKMNYHTTLKYWDVIYTIRYPPYYQTEHLFGKEANNRKEARKLAQQAMNNAKPDDWKNKLSPFYQNLIKEYLQKIPTFMKI